LKHEEPRRENSNGDGNPNNLSPGAALDRFVRIDLGLQLDSFRRNFKRPRKNERDRSAEHDDDNEYPHYPGRGVESRKENGCRLNQQPSDNCVRDCNFVNVAPL
jgi:hypothetical protein